MSQPAATPVVDSHCHAAEGWYEPVEMLLHQMDLNRVDHAVLIQIQGQANNEYQFECVRRYPGRFANVVIVDVERPDAPATLTRLAERGASGVRLRASARSPGDDPLLIWRTAERLGLAVSVPGSGQDFASDDFARLVESLPDLKVVVEHQGGIQRPGAAPDPELTARVCALARHRNTYVKIHGLGEFSQRALPVQEPFPFVEPIPPVLDRLVDAWGPARTMWGSDYPPVSGREGYRNALRLVEAELAGRGQADRALIFGGTAAAVFPVRG